MEIHPYSGAQYAAPQAPQAIAPKAPAQALQARTQGMQAVNNHIHGMETAIYDRMEYTLDQQRKLYLQQTQGEIEAALVTAMRAPDGTKNSLWNADGSFRDEYYQQFMQTQLSRLDGMDKGYIRPEHQEAARAQTLELKSKIKTSMDVQVAESLAPRAKSATLNLAKWQAEQGQYESAMSTIIGCPDYAISERERDQAVIGVIQESVMGKAREAVATNNPDQYLRIVSNPTLMQDMTPDQRFQLLRMQSQFPDTDPPADQLALPGKKSTTTKTKKAATPLPLGVTDDLVALHDKWLDDNGKFPKNGRAQQEAIAALDSYFANYVTPDLKPEERLHLKNVASCFGLTDSDVDTLIAKHMAPFEMQRGSFDYDKTMKDLPRGTFVTPQSENYLTEIKTLLAEANANLNTLSTNPDATEEEIRAAKKSAEDLDARLQIETEKVARRADALRTEVQKQFSDWYIKQDADKITDIEMKMKLFDIVDSVVDTEAGPLATSNPRDFSSSFQYKKLAKQQQQAFEARNAALDRRTDLHYAVRVTDAKRLAEEAEEKNESTQFSAASSFPVSTAYSMDIPGSTSESFIAVPKDSPLAGKSLALKYNGRTRLIPCKESEVSSPTLSMRARLNMGLLNEDNATFTIAHDADGNATLIKTTVPPAETSMYDVIMQQEIRRDKSGRPAIYNLPQADGGGDYEIAGLNQKSNPKELAHLRAMIENGAPTEKIEEYIRSVYKTKTQYGADMLTYRHSQGIELFMRDCAMNHSPQGVRTIVANAVGVRKDHPNLPQAIASFVHNHGEAALLQNLAIARANYYSFLVTTKPDRKIFFQGWMNRNRNVSQASRSLLSKPAL